MFGLNSMRYEIVSGVVIKTENAAKPASQSSGFLKSLLGTLPRVSTSIDYGCGKLRYLDAILEKTDFLTLVDSEIQLSRIQTRLQQCCRKSDEGTIGYDTDFQC